MSKKPRKAPTAVMAAMPTAGQAAIPNARAILIVAGVSGSGKTTIATALAQRLGWPLQEGDELHPRPDIAKVNAAHPLDDREQWSWLQKVATWIDDRWQTGTGGGVITLPALRRSHRDFLTSGRPQVRIVYLHGERALIATRLAARATIHYSGPPGATLRSPRGARPRRGSNPHRCEQACGGHRCRDPARNRSAGTRQSAGGCGPRAHRATCRPACQTVRLSASRHWCPARPWNVRQIRPSARYRGLCTDRRLHDGRSRRSQRLDRLAVLAALRQQCVVRSPSRHVRTW